MRERKLSEIEDLIRAGQIARARSSLKSVDMKSLRRTEWAYFAELCRRSGLSKLSIRRLQPAVRPGLRSAGAASDDEKIEYAAALSQLGALHEAQALLAELRSAAAKAKLIEAFNWIKDWHYDRALPLLQAYLKDGKISAYQRLIGEVNLLACLVEEDRGDAEALVRDLLAKTQESNLRRLRFNVLELSAQRKIRRADYSSAQEDLQLALELTANSQSLDAFFVEKWKVICSAFSGQLSKKNLPSRFAALKERAVLLGSFETVRECDFYLSILMKNARLLSSVYFCTPNEIRRQRYLAQFEKHNGRVKLPSCVLVQRKGGQLSVVDSASFRLSVSSGAYSAEGGDEIYPFSRASSFLRCLKLLARDLYRPMEEARLAIELFQSHYHVIHSKNRIYQVLHRLRRSLESVPIPLRIVMEHGRISLESRADFAIEVTGEKAVPTLDRRSSEFLRQIPSGREFAMRDLRQLFQGKSERSLQRLLSDGLTAGRIEKIGAGRSLRYRKRS